MGGAGTVVGTWRGHTEMRVDAQGHAHQQPHLPPEGGQESPKRVPEHTEEKGVIESEQH